MMLTDTHVVFRITFVILYVFSANVNGAAVTSPENVTPTNVNSTNHFSKVGEERVDIVYNSKDLKEISHDGILKLQVIGNPSEVIVECQYTGNVSEAHHAFVDWTYNYDGIDEIIPPASQNFAYINLGTGSPVARMECALQNKSLTSSWRNVTLIYRGGDKAPYLYNHGKMVNATVFNESLVRLPCVLKYPIDNHGHKIEIQLLKDETEIDEKYWKYLPEHGYILNFSKLENPYGEYKCKVINSTVDDFVSMELWSDDVVRAGVNVTKLSRSEHFYAGDPTPRFQCNVPMSHFQNKFNWLYLYSNGTYEQIQPWNRKTSSEHSYYKDTVRINFPSSNITQVVCVGYLNNTSNTRYNNSVTVKVKEPIMLEIAKKPLEGPVIYKDGINLTCYFQGEPISHFSWTKNGKDFGHAGQHHNFLDRSTTLHLNPPVYNEGESNYTCTAFNFMGNMSHTYKVKLPEANPVDGRSTSSNTLYIILGVLTVGVIVFVLVFRVHLQRRRFDPEKIRLFLNGIGPDERSNNDYSHNPDHQVPEPVDSVPYDTGHEISLQSLNFVKELKKGNFGKVDMGRVTDKKTGKCTIVAIKSIINDKPDVTPEELENEFVNFLKEIKRSQILGKVHPNVVGYIGAVTADLSQYSAYLVVEYCAGGDIRSLMSKGGTFYDEIQGERHDFPCAQSNETTSSMGGVILRTSHLMRWAEEAASGMEYIHSKGLLHRDIAIRNILLAIHPDHNQDCDCLDPSILIAKISDFGLSKDLHELPKDYYQIVIHADPQQNRPHPLPLRWLAIESLETLRFTKESDFWTFGVALWEMFTLGSIPYENEISRNYGGDLRLKLISHLRHNKNILPEPEFAPFEIWEVMKSCWNMSPDERPNFQDLKQRIHEINLEFNEANSVTDSDSDSEEQQQVLHYADIATLPTSMEGYSSISAVQNVAYDQTGDSESGGESDDDDIDNQQHGDSDSACMNESYENDQGCRPDYLSVVTVSRITCEGDEIAENCDSNYNSLVNVKS